MDPVSDVSKVANRKRMGDDVEQLREKKSGERSKIINLKVAQETAYWDLKEKLQGVEANHERLQANMVDAELRRRPETLNKLAASRAIADTLEENVARLRDLLSDLEAADRAEAEWGNERVTLAGEVRADRDALAQLETDAAGERARLEVELEAERETRARLEAELEAEREKRARLEAALAAGEQRAALLLADQEEERARGRAALAACADTIADLIRDVDREAEALARLEEALKARDATLRKNEANRIKIINDLRAKKERLQERLQEMVHGMQGTINFIQMDQPRDRPTTNTLAVPAVREPAERGDGTKLDLSFLMSDTSGDSMSFDAGEVERKVRGAAGGRGRKREVRAETRPGTPYVSSAANRSSAINSSGAASRYFFKTKRQDAKRK